MRHLDELLRRGGSVRVEYVPETRGFVAHWTGPDAWRCSAMATTTGEACAALLRRIRERPPPSTIHERVAAAIGWSLEDVQSLPLPALRNVVRAVSPKLSEEISRLIRGGEALRADLERGAAWGRRGADLDAVARARRGRK